MLAALYDLFSQTTSDHYNPAMRARATRRVVDRINLWLAIAGVVAYLMQPTVIDRESYRLSVPASLPSIFQH